MRTVIYCYNPWLNCNSHVSYGATVVIDLGGGGGGGGGEMRAGYIQFIVFGRGWGSVSSGDPAATLVTWL